MKGGSDTLTKLNYMLNNDHAVSPINRTRLEEPVDSTFKKLGEAIVSSKRKEEKMTKAQQNAMLLQELGLSHKKGLYDDAGVKSRQQNKPNGNISIADQSIFMMDLNMTSNNIITP